MSLNCPGNGSVSIVATLDSYTSTSDTIQQILQAGASAVYCDPNRSSVFLTSFLVKEVRQMVQTYGNACQILCELPSSLDSFAMWQSASFPDWWVLRDVDDVSSKRAQLSQLRLHTRFLVRVISSANIDAARLDGCGVMVDRAAIYAGTSGRDIYVNGQHLISDAAEDVQGQAVHYARRLKCKKPVIAAMSEWPAGKAQLDAEDVRKLTIMVRQKCDALLLPDLGHSTVHMVGMVDRALQTVYRLSR